MLNLFISTILGKQNLFYGGWLYGTYDAYQKTKSEVKSRVTYAIA